jgi:16S rRNA (cytidine1402-2'-O)-methyltransferase
VTGAGAAGGLWVIGTPIGNLEDLTPRAARALAECDVVAAEDTRRARVLLGRAGVQHKPMVRLDAHAERGSAVERLVERMRGGESVALVTDAGTPVVSDPGTALVRAARAAGVPVRPVPGPSAVTAAISVSGLVEGAFRFVGFLPRSGDERRRAIARMRDDDDAQVFFESPQRIAETLADLAAAMPERQALVARELTKIHEELVGGSLGELAAAAATRAWLGEITVVLSPLAARDRELAQLDDETVLAAIDRGLAAGERPRYLADRLAVTSGRPRRELYALAVQRRAGPQADDDPTGEPPTGEP